MLAVLVAVYGTSAFAAPASSTQLVTVAQSTTLRHGDVVTGTLAATQPMRVSIALKMRDRAGLDAFINANAKTLKSNPMSRQEFMANHAPTVVQAQTVANYLTAMGYKNVVIAPNRLMVSADGTAATASKAFLTSFKQVRTHDGRNAFANATEARVPASLGDKVLAVLGLQTVNQGHTFAVRAKKNAPGKASLVGHNPVEFSSIYSGTGVQTAAGVPVGIFTSGDVSQTITDLNTFTAANNLPQVVTEVVKTNGGGDDTSGVGEWNMDSQAIVGMGGGEVGKIIFYSTPSLSFADMNDNFNTIVTANATKIINVSIGGCELGAKGADADAANQIFAMGVAQGQTFSISTGDSGADECGDGGTTPSWPANSPYVVAAAGTRLDATTGASATWADETVWSGTGGSPSTYEPKPSWQQLLVPGDFRGVADIAFDADPNTGALVTVDGSLEQIGGTSLSAPIFAGMWARVLSGTDYGFAAPLLYALPQSDFHDVTVGDNGGESAAVGYDFASGRGSVILNTAINHIGKPIGKPPVANFSYVAKGLSVQFTDSSTDKDGTIFKHFWNFGDGSAVSETANPTHVFAGAGTYSVSETVADNDLNTATRTRGVVVVAAGGSNQLIGNSGFETGVVPWVMSPFVRNNSSAQPAHGGQWDVWMGGPDKFSKTDSISQTFTIPTKKSSANLSFWLHIDSNEVSPIRKFDKMSVLVIDGFGTVHQIASFSNLDKADGYKNYNYDMSAYIGQKIKLKFISTEDGSIQTSFVLDDVTLLAK